ncbi:MAG: dihydrofolate reductase [Lachnospiraceae bacterium]|nr:dihydrofolate reductase [Lachnospiraceae bacterium]
MNLYVTADANWAIGNNDNLLIQIPRSQKLFFEETKGKVVVMGRKALATMPQGLPLAGRTNIILSQNKDLKIKGAIVVHSIEELLKELEQYPSEEIYVVGGESVYSQMLSHCNVAHVVKLDHAYNANKYFPNLDKDPEWRMTADSDELTYFDVAYEFLRYERVTSTN